MGERGAHNEAATPEDIEKMAAVVRDGIKAGALGFTTSRTMLHRAKNKELVPGTFASEDELLGIGRALGQAGHGVFEMASDMVGPDATMEWMVKLSAETGLPITFAMAQTDKEPNSYRKMMARVKELNAKGAHLAPQISARPTGLLMGLESSLHPFITHPTYKTIAHLPIDERVAKMREPAMRAQILSEEPSVHDKATRFMVTNFTKFFPLGDPPDYEPTRESSVAARAEKMGVSAAELTYDLLLERNGRELLYMPFGNYAEYNHNALREMLLDPVTTLGLSDGGAHCGLICDASMPSYMLSHWVRGRSRGERMPVETAVRLQTSDTAKLYGLNDRGILAPGMKADVNVIDLDALKLHAPQMVFDLPAGGRRLIQRAEGYRFTILSGEVTFQDGVPTEAMPGKLIRGPQADPRATA
jgi:N-acyl-D-aspartate/D-glutamate deacylase